MITDELLAVFATALGVSLVLLVILLYNISANTPRKFIFNASIKGAINQQRVSGLFNSPNPKCGMNSLD